MVDGNAVDAGSVRLNPREALERLKSGNDAYLNTRENRGDLSKETAERLFNDGQQPYACIITCADSRVVPEFIFSAGVGELYCIRVAGNVVGDMELASALHAASHLNTSLIVVLGHTHCDAIETAMEFYDNKVPAEGDAIAPLAWTIIAGTDGDHYPVTAAIANVRFGMEALLAEPEIKRRADEGSLQVVGALYHTDSGEVDFLD